MPQTLVIHAHPRANASLVTEAMRQAREEFERQLQDDLQRQRQHAPTKGWDRPQ